tara:strand:+ start:96 stop:1022 length:927 start_codon:yes stop_codon:yes gene_type:complete
MSKLDVIIVNWNSGRFLSECINSILNSNHEDINKVIVIDNASEDGSSDHLPIFDKLEIHKNRSNQGFAKACNQGTKYAVSENILFLNPDTKLFENTISGALEKFKQNINIGILGISLVDEKSNVVKTCSRFLSARRVFSHSIGLTRLFKSTGMAMHDWDHKISGEVDQVMGAFFLTRKELFNDLQGFDETFFVYYEEMDFCFRAKLKGYKTFYEASVQAYHYGGGTTENIISERLFYSLRSRILYSIKHLNFVSCFISIFSTLVIEMISRIFVLSILRFSFVNFIISSEAFLKLIAWLLKRLYLNIKF